MLRQYLEEKHNDQFINVFNLGIGGNTSDDILKRFKTESEARMPTDVIFAFGVNDSGYFRALDKPIVPEDRFTKNITFMGLTLGDDSLLKPFPESSQGKSYDLNRTKNYDRKLSEVAAANQCKFISLLDVLKFDDFLDGLHPNETGHRNMFEVVKNHF